MRRQTTEPQTQNTGREREFMPQGQQLCRVNACRFAGTHVTGGHKCGTCGAMGHGQLECGRTTAIRRLAQFCNSDHMPPGLECTIPFCPNKHLHSTAAHECGICHIRGVACGCPVVPTTASTQTVSVTCPVCKSYNDSVNTDNVAYTGTECVICMESGPCVIFPTCRHANVCSACTKRLADA